MTLTALYEWFAQDCAQAAEQTRIRKIVKCCSSWQSSGCSTHDGAPPKNRRCCRRRGARLSASVRDQGRCELKLAFARVTSPAREQRRRHSEAKGRFDGDRWNPGLEI